MAVGRLCRRLDSKIGRMRYRAQELREEMNSLAAAVALCKVPNPTPIHQIDTRQQEVDNITRQLLSAEPNRISAEIGCIRQFEVVAGQPVAPRIWMKAAHDAQVGAKGFALSAFEASAKLFNAASATAFAFRASFRPLSQRVSRAHLCPPCCGDGTQVKAARMRDREEEHSDDEALT